jgi:hypothetical protein
VFDFVKPLSPGRNLCAPGRDAGLILWRAMGRLRDSEHYRENEQSPRSDRLSQSASFTPVRRSVVDDAVNFVPSSLERQTPCRRGLAPLGN